jgi:hypothetical protein
MPEKVLQMGYMSGDTYTAAVWLKLNPGSKIVLIKDTKEKQDKTEKIILSFYRECGVAGQVSLLDISATTLTAKDVWASLKDAYTSAKDVNARRRADPLFNTEASKVYNVSPAGWPRGITAVTGLVANAWNANPAATGKTIAALWKVVKIDGELFEALDAFVSQKFNASGLVFRKNFVVLWSRQSGKRGGAHVELDSSFEGIRQLARYFAVSKGNATVLLAGDESNGKLAALAAESPQIVNLSNMWEDDAWKKEPLKGSPYLGQFAFFRHTAQLVNVVHVGMRSGILEAMSLMGMETFYLEPSACPSGKRMVAFSRANMPYTRVQISAPAGLTASNAQLAIEKGVPAPTLGGWQLKVQRQIDYLMRSNQYRNYYYTEVKGKRVFNETNARRDAPIYAKAKVLAEDLLNPGAADYPAKREAILKDLLTKSPAQVQLGMRTNRGFYDEDLAKITDAVEATLK